MSKNPQSRIIVKARPKLGALFSYDWDAYGLARLQDQFDIQTAGFDLFSFPSNANLITFNFERFTRKMVKLAKAQSWQGVVSHHEQFGALAAALIAQELKLPGTKPEAVLACQHKVYAREVLSRVCPEANLRYEVMPAQYGEPIPPGLAYPSFAKPVKAAFSVLARHVANHAELTAHTRFGRRELWVIRRLVEPFERVMQARLPGASSAHRLILEEPLDAPQYNLDGYMHQGEMQVLGVVDAVMYPGTQSFMRFDYPSRLPQAIQAQAASVAEKFLKAIGFTHGYFNMEFFYDEASQRLAVIEFNPRLSTQMADLYYRVQGINIVADANWLSMGIDPASMVYPRTEYGAASSFVYRSFDPNFVPVMPTLEQQQRLQQRFPDAYLLLFPKTGYSLKRDFKWLSSHRYAVLHLSGKDEQDLRARCEEASAIVGYAAPYAS
jgi:ATP-grasp domain